ncbi:hypothetical protein [Demequina aurantiaca]|uniref:hypothetical protein n=1 Tax=Demequina aurantiaca TaxID=676200 RepID=UPI000785F1D6|nr:hypothetical protein [Demequina aurantiaca]
MTGSENVPATEHEKTAALHEIAEEVVKEREERGHSVLDGEKVVSNESDYSEGNEDATLAEDVQSIPPARPGGN